MGVALAHSDFREGSKFVQEGKKALGLFARNGHGEDQILHRVRKRLFWECIGLFGDPKFLQARKFLGVLQVRIGQALGSTKIQEGSLEEFSRSGRARSRIFRQGRKLGR